MSFLKAEWRNLILANYEVSPDILKPYIPAGTELDLWNNRCFVSLVGFMFVNTHIKGIKIPFHVNFEEVNLRFYVKRFENGEWKRGVVFIKEIVPRIAITTVANLVYKENYETLSMSHSWLKQADTFHVSYKWKKKGKWHSMEVTAHPTAGSFASGSETEFITEHYWGYARVNEHMTNEYAVNHPRWNAFDVLQFHIDVDFGTVYGSTFAFLNALTPTSVMLAEGSEITVEKKRRLS